MTSQFEMNEEDKLYDEFGNYIGPELSDADSDDTSDDSDSDEASDWDEFAVHDRSPIRQQRNNNNQTSIEDMESPEAKQQELMDADNDSNVHDAHANADDNDVDINGNGPASSNAGADDDEHPDSIAQFHRFTAETMQLIPSTGGAGSGSGDDADADDVDGHGTANAIVLHEDKQYYRSAEETYPGAETLIQEEDTQPLETPIIAPVKQKCFELIETSLPTTKFDYKFLASMTDKPELIRNLAFIGHLHHGKTSFLDILVKQTHLKDWNNTDSTKNNPPAGTLKTRNSNGTNTNNNYNSRRRRRARSNGRGDEIRYCDTRIDEQNRGISIKATPISLILADLHAKHFLLNMMDTPGHTNFSDEVTAALRLVDGCVIVVDAIEGVLLNTERLIRHAAQRGLPMVLVINKIDRLIIELRLPPRDAYLKILFTLQEVNNVLKSVGITGEQLLDPRKNNVCFASAWFGFSFSLASFAKIYCDFHGHSFNYEIFATKLWGDCYLHSVDRKFYAYPESERKNHNHNKNKNKNKSKSKSSKQQKQSQSERKHEEESASRNNASAAPMENKRTFVSFILEPLYKIFSHTLGNDPEKLFPLFEELGIRLKKKELHLDPKKLLNVILSRFFGCESAGFVSMVIEHIPPPTVANKIKVSRCYTGDLNTDLGMAMIRCDPRYKSAIINVTKMYSRPDASEFDAFGRVFAGTIKVGDQIRVLRENYKLDDNEDMKIMKIEKIWIYQGRYRVEVNRMTAGNWALFGGIDSAIDKTATLVHDNQYSTDACIFKPLMFNTVSVCKVAIEPIKPSELPKMTHGLRCINKSYPLCVTKVEESGEHVILGTGELYLDCVLHDLRLMYSEIEIKVSDPVVVFCETVDETSNMQCFAFTANKKNKLTMVCEPLENRIASDIENENISIEWTPRQLSEFFQSNYNWDLLSARNIWAFGPSQNGANILIDDTLPSSAPSSSASAAMDDNTNTNNPSNGHFLNSKAIMNETGVRSNIVQGFEWATREGPLCDEPIRNCTFRLMDAQISQNSFERSGGQIIPTARRVIYSSFMLASPRLMEPILFVEGICPADCISAMEDVVHHRRGRLLKEIPKPGTPFVVVNAEIPAIDSFGFETDLRSHTQGQAFCLQVFHRWDIVPGDPMDDSIVLMPLEPHPPEKLAREFMIKTRKRKGLAENVTYHKFFDDQMFKAFVQLTDGLDDQ